ncbi:hypothetical protein WDW89_23930 [Deltaproteobacteria bacterium TL4]
MDDIVCFGQSKAELYERKEQIETFVNEQLLLKLKDKASLLAPVSEGLPYLGLRIFRGTLRLQRGRWLRFQHQFKKQERLFLQGKLSKDRFLNSINGLSEQTRWANTLRARQYFLRDHVALDEVFL